MSNLEVAMLLKARDEGSRVVARGMSEIAKEAKGAEGSVSGVTRESKRMSDARQILGVRAEQAIQREIRQSEAAYRRLAAAGTMSAREQSRAYDAMRQKVSELRREMAGVNTAQRAIATAARGLVGAGAGAMAAGYVVAQPMRRVASYDMRLAQMTNTAFADTEDASGRKLSQAEQLERRRAGKSQLEGYITAATGEGGTRDDTAAALDKLIARGIFSPEQAGKLLPTINKAATAAGSSSEEMTDVVMAAVQNAKIPVEEIPKALGMALRAGQMGGFELKDMARWLPKMLAMGGLSGLRGQDGLASILAASQLAVTAAGGSDDAGNNVVNLLQKITSADTAADFKKLSSRTMGDKNKGDPGIDLYGTLAQARKEGVDPVEAFTRLVRRVAEADKDFATMQKRAKESGDDKDKSAMYGGMADILMARGVGKTIQDRQAMLGLLPMLFNPKAYTDMKQGILQGDETALTVNQAFIKEQAGFKFQQGQNAVEKGEYDSIGKLNGAVGDVVGKLAEYGAQYPSLTASVMGATVAIKAMAAAAMAGGAANLLAGRAGAAGAGALAGQVGGAARLAGAAAGASRFARFAAPVALLGAGFEAYNVSQNKMLTDGQRKSEYTRVTGGVGGALAGAAAGAAIGSAVPLVGTAIGGIAGGILGSLGGEGLGKMLGDALFRAETAKQPQPITVPVTVNLDGRQVAEAVNQVNAQSGRRN
ncbi:phage tail tape measure protein [Cupriavidus sp. 30B13]|uniref:phage tail tape measure protein n=1 Tax=Cupriavidus sp. 30B13 TaxID=3384241 RepID=UPI003B9129D6